jgi:hypothetical protein
MNDKAKPGTSEEAMKRNTARARCSGLLAATLISWTKYRYSHPQTADVYHDGHSVGGTGTSSIFCCH